MSISLKIKELRKNKKLTQKEFSSIIKIDDSQFSKIEQGKLQPTLNQLLEISSNFNISLDELCFDKQAHDNNVVNEPSEIYNIIPTKKDSIPLIPIEAMAGYGGGQTQVLELD
ncbi:TPA: helix-turn-helix domain-containing protein, partial [Flavobacterium psychrophilum]